MNRLFKARVASVADAQPHGKSAEYVYQAATVAAALLILLTLSLV